MMEKQAQRRDCFSAIKSLSTEEKDEKSRAIVSHLEANEAFRQAHTVFSYLALASEPDLSELVLRHSEKTWGFSRVRADGSRLLFHKVTSQEQLRLGKFGFSEPDPELCPILENADLILIPGVGFDSINGARLGRGKGHYDRFLGPIRQSDQSLPFFGICFSVQIRNLSPEAHDIPMDALITEDGVEEIS